MKFMLVYLCTQHNSCSITHFIFGSEFLIRIFNYFHIIKVKLTIINWYMKAVITNNISSVLLQYLTKLSIQYMVCVFKLAV